MKNLILISLLMILNVGCSMSYDVDPRLAVYMPLIEKHLGDIYHTKEGHPINYEVRKITISDKILGACYPASDRDGGFKALVVIDLEKAEAYFKSYRGGELAENVDARFIALIAHEAAHCAWGAKHTDEKGLLIDKYTDYPSINALNIEEKLQELRNYID